MSATIKGIDHINLDVPSEHLETVCRFYADAVGLKAGYRPDFNFDGRWLYAEGVEHALLHLASYGDDDTAPLHQNTGRFNHVCFAMQGLAEHRASLQQAGIEFRESNRPHAQVVQLFLTDPTGVMVELNFSKAAEGLSVAPATA